MPQKAEKRGNDGNELEPAEAVRDALEVPVEEVAHFSADVVRVLAVRGDDFVDDADERVGLVRIHEPEAPFVAAFKVEKVAAEVAPDGRHVNQLPDGKVDGKEGHKDKRHAGRADHRVDVGESVCGEFHVYFPLLLLAPFSRLREKGIEEMIS